MQIHYCVWAYITMGEFLTVPLTLEVSRCQPYPISRTVLWCLTVTLVREALPHSCRSFQSPMGTFTHRLTIVEPAGTTVSVVFQGYKSGCKPLTHWKGVMLVTESFREFFAYSTHGKKLGPVILIVSTIRAQISPDLLTVSLQLSVWLGVITWR